jgi:hypothetical protein
MGQTVPEANGETVVADSVIPIAVQAVSAQARGYVMDTASVVRRM